MKIFSFIFVMFIIATLVASVTMYTAYGIYGSKKLLYIMALFGFFPFITAIVGSIFGRESIERYLGHFLFYYNYISIFCILLVLIQAVSLVIHKNFFEYLSKNRLEFSTIFLIGIGMLALYGKTRFDNVTGIVKDLKIAKKNENKITKIGFISDIHLNKVFDGKKLDFALKKMHDEGTELVIIGGDFVDNNSSHIAPGIKDIIEKYTFKHGIHTVLGNHEYYGGIDKNIDYIKGVGINILRDDVLKIDDIYIIGRDDKFNTAKKSLVNFRAEIPEENTVIVVDHNPVTLLESIENKVDLHLSGHTHNGQLFPMNFLTDYLNLNGNGYRKFEETHSFVSSGLGTWLIPYRIGSQSQYVILNLQFE